MKRLSILFFILSINFVSSQAFYPPPCPSNSIFAHNGNAITQHGAPNGPGTNVLTNLPAGAGGLAIGPAFGFPAPNPTWWTTSGGTYWYYSNAGTWVNTGHTTGNGAAVNLGGGGGFIYNLVGATGQIYVYNGTGNGFLLTTLTPPFGGGGPYDVVVDQAGNFFILKASTPGQGLYVYSPSGALTCSYAANGMISQTAGGGFAILPSTTNPTIPVVYYNSNGTDYIGNILPGSTSINFTSQPLPNGGDYASCPVPIPTGSVIAPNGGSITCVQPQVTLVAQVNGNGSIGWLGGYSSPTTSPVSPTCGTIQWSGPGIVSGQSTPTIIVNQPGVYSFTLSGCNTCPNYTISASYTVTGQGGVITPVINAPTCFSGTAVMSVLPNTPTNTVLWTGPGIVGPNNTFTIQFNQPGIYSVSISGGTNCTGSASVQVFQIPNLSLTASSSSICSQNILNAPNTVTFTGSGATNYTWTLNNFSTGSSTALPTITANPVAGQTIGSVTLTGAQGPCTQTASISVNIIPNPVISAPTCVSGNTVMTASPFISTVNVNWSGPGIVSGGNTHTLTFNQGGTYTVSFNGSCIQTVNVIQSPTVSIASSSPWICQNGFNNSPNTVTFNANGATSYTWVSSHFNITTPGAISIVSGLNTQITGNATIMLIGQNGPCTNTAMANIQVIQNPTVSVNSVSVCFGNSVNINAGGATSYTWTPSNGLNTTSGPNVIGYPNTTTQYSVVGYQSGCYRDFAPLTVTVVPLPQITVAPLINTICVGSTLNLIASGANNYTWQPNSYINNTSSSAVNVYPPVTTNYTVIGEASTCTSSAVYQVSVIPIPNLMLNITTDTICKGLSVPLYASGAWSYTWSTGHTTSSLMVSPNVTTVYQVTGNNGQCSAVKQVTIVVIPYPDYQITANPQKICYGNSTQLSAPGGMTYSWSPSNSLNNPHIHNPIATPFENTNYTVMVSNYLGTKYCTVTKEYSVEVVPKVEIFAASPYSICIGEKITLVAGGNAEQYQWQPTLGISNPNLPKVDVSPTANIIYTVTGISGGYCKDSKLVQVIVRPKPDVYAGRDTTFNLDEPMFLNATGTGTMTWISGDGILCKVCPQTQIMPKSSGCYIVQSVNEFGCKAEDDVCIEVTTDYNLYIPNSFSPNGDGINDVFRIYGTGLLKTQLTIYDRWGEKIFTSNEFEKGWDGTHKGVMCKEDVYVWQLKFKSLDGKERTKTGHVTLLK
ncbi:MAG: gliding motility-associated C-terminal domain-containing protein [Bacteroidia bacterium]|nr:gliding motility-associated C-terminal domain-containing protein [Bacteroidia bacterium]